MHDIVRPTEGATLGIARFLVETRLDGMTEAVIEKAEHCVLDSIGCSLAGAASRRGRIVRALAEDSGSRCSIIGGSRASALEAAFANAMTANALELDDTFDRPGSIIFAHPGATVIPAALAVAELTGRSGRELIEAVILGYEVCLRVGVAVQPSLRRAMEEVWGCATFQTFGAVAAAAKLLRLDLDQTLDALGIAGATAPLSSTLKVWRTDHADMHNAYGWAAEAGVRAALLAARGYTAPRDILDGNTGFWRMYGSDQCDFAVFTEGLGERYWILDVSFKPWAACRWAHPIMDAARMVVERHGIPLATPAEVAAIDRVTVRTFRSIINTPYDNYRPTNLLEAQFSTPFCTAVALLGQQPEEHHFAEGRIADERISNLLRKVELLPDETAERLFPANGGDTLAATVELTIGDRRHECFIRHPWGDPRNPMSRVDLEAKLVRNAPTSLGAAQPSAIIASLRQLPTMPAVSGISDCLIAAAGPANRA